MQKWPGLSLFLPVFCAVLIADQISKQTMLDLVFNPPRYIEIGLLLNIVPVWNSGMSFGMLADGGLIVRIGLTVLAFVVSGWFVSVVVHVTLITLMIVFWVVLILMPVILILMLPMMMAAVIMKTH